jgi:hypothetical protein
MPDATADHRSERSRALIESALEIRLRSLRLELEIAHTMLDASCTTRVEATRQRQRLRAEEACSEVSRALAADPAGASLSDAARAELERGVARVQERLAAAC